MSVTSSTSSATFAGNGATVDFDFTFPYQANTDLVVTVDGVVQALNTDYTVAPASSPTGGRVETLFAPDPGAVVVVERVVPLTQQTNFLTQGSFSPALHEAALDKLTMAAQQLARRDDELEAATTAVDVRVDEVIVSTFPAQAGQAGKVLGTDGSEASWVEKLPAQAGHASKVLGTDGATASWVRPLGRLLYQSPHADVLWDGSGETVGKSYTLPAGTFGMGATLQFLRIQALWKSNADGNSKPVKLMLGDSVLRTDNLINLRHLYLDCIVGGAGGGFGECINRMTRNGVAGYNDSAYAGEAQLGHIWWPAQPTGTLSVDQLIKITISQPTATALWLRVELFIEAP